MTQKREKQEDQGRASAKIRQRQKRKEDSLKSYMRKRDIKTGGRDLKERRGWERRVEAMRRQRERDKKIEG